MLVDMEHLYTRGVKDGTLERRDTGCAREIDLTDSLEEGAGKEKVRSKGMLSILGV